MISRKNINAVVNETIMQFPSIGYKCNLQERMDEVGINLTELSNLTGIRYATLNDLKNAKKVTLNLQHVFAVMVALRLESFNDLFEITFVDADDAKRFKDESELYRKNGLPETELKRMEENKIRLAR